MKVVRIVCPGCGKEDTRKLEMGKLKSYEEIIVRKRCPECRKNPTPEEKLLRAIFGEKDDD